MTDKLELARVAFEASQSSDCPFPKYPGGWDAMPQYHRDVWKNVAAAVAKVVERDQQQRDAQMRSDDGYWCGPYDKETW